MEYDQQLVNLAFEILRSDPEAVGPALREKAEAYLAGLFSQECEDAIAPQIQ